MSESRFSLDTLDVLGIGMCVEMFPQSHILKSLIENQRGSFLPTSPKAYWNTKQEKKNALHQRSVYALRTAVENFVQHWPISSVCVWPYANKKRFKRASAQLGILRNVFPL